MVTIANSLIRFVACNIYTNIYLRFVKNAHIPKETQIYLYDPLKKTHDTNIIINIAINSKLKRILNSP